MNREEAILNYPYLDEPDLKSLVQHLGYVPKKVKMPDVKLFFKNCKSNHTLFIQHLITNNVVVERSLICCPKCDKGRLSKPFETKETEKVMDGIKRNINSIKHVEELIKHPSNEAELEDELDDEFDPDFAHNVIVNRLLHSSCDVCGLDTYAACDSYKVENLKTEEILIFVK